MHLCILKPIMSLLKLWILTNDWLRIMSGIGLWTLQVVHCDLALRNVLVSRFPWEIKVAEFGLARDLTRMRSRRSTRNKQQRVRCRLAQLSQWHELQSPYNDWESVYCVVLGTSALALVSSWVFPEQLLQLQGGRLGLWHCPVGNADVWWAKMRPLISWNLT